MKSQRSPIDTPLKPLMNKRIILWTVIRNGVVYGLQKCAIFMWEKPIVTWDDGTASSFALQPFSSAGLNINNNSMLVLSDLCMDRIRC